MIKKIGKFIMVVICIAVIVATVMFVRSYIQYKDREINELKREVQARADNELQQKLLKEELNKVENLVESIDNQTQFVLLRTNGICTLKHDKTPDNNKWTEWLFNSDIVIYADYVTVFTIDTSNISISVSEDVKVTITYDERDIELSAIDIKDLTTSTSKSLFGSGYTANQIAAFQSIARDSIYNNSFTKENIAQANANLDTLLEEIADSFGVTNIEFVSK